MTKEAGAADLSRLCLGCAFDCKLNDGDWMDLQFANAAPGASKLETLLSD
jgi:hypothetical protein